MRDEISDYRQLAAIRKKMDQNLAERLSLTSLYYCGAKVPTCNPGVAIIRNNKTAKFVGNSSCKSSWCCPVCTAKQMTKYATEIACAIDALKEQKIYAVMFTFTVPHTRDFTCAESLKILVDTWKMFTVHGNKQKNGRFDIFTNFVSATESKHRVRVAEFTYGKSGWHPHFHCLLWFPEKHLAELLDWEERLNERWLELTKRFTIKALSSRPEAQREKVLKRVNAMYSKLDKDCNGVYISKSDGKVIISESSQYICGWGSDRELTGNYQEKATHENHYTWQQILAKAIDADAAEQAPEAEKFWSLYFEYAKATRNVRRIIFSAQSGLKAIISQYKQTHAWKEYLKKKHTSLVQNSGQWTMVCWFSRSQWSELFQNNVDLVHLLELAMGENAYENICAYVAGFNIEPPTKDCEWKAVILEIYNAA